MKNMRRARQVVMVPNILHIQGVALPEFRGSPWAYMYDEWEEIEATILWSVNSKPCSLEAEYPHIINVLLVLMRTLDGQYNRFAHHLKSLTLNNILDIFRDSKKSIVLTNTVHNLSTMGWTLFLGVHTAVETFNTLHSNVLALLSYELNKQTVVVKKVRAFIGRIAHWILADMVTMYWSSELADM